MDYDKHIDSFLAEARNVSAGIDAYTPKGFTGWALISIIATIVSLFGLITLIQGAIVPFFGLKIAVVGDKTIAVEHVAFVISLFFAIFAFIIILTYLLSLLSDSHKRLFVLRSKYVSLISQSSPIFQELRSHSFVLANLSKVSSLTKELLDADEPHSAESLIKTMNIILGDIQSVFDRVTDDTCSVCVKILNSIDDRLEVKTWIRDSRSTFDRGYVDQLKGTQEYAAYANTAFREIIDAKSGKHYFLCNDLKMLAADGKYQNANPNWSEHYNAALVVPLAREQHSIKGFLGFLCVDNMKGNFDSQVCLPILKTYSSILQMLFLTVTIDKENRRSNKGVKNDKETLQDEGRGVVSTRRRKSIAQRRKKAR